MVCGLGFMPTASPSCSPTCVTAPACTASISPAGGSLRSASTAGNIPTSPRTRVMAFEISRPADQLVPPRVTLDPKSAPARRLFESSGSDLMPSVSPEHAHRLLFGPYARTAAVVRQCRRFRFAGAGRGLRADQRQPVRWMEDSNTVLSIGYAPTDAVRARCPAFVRHRPAQRPRAQASAAGRAGAGQPVVAAAAALMPCWSPTWAMAACRCACWMPARRRGELARRDGVGEPATTRPADAVWYVRTASPPVAYRSGTGHAERGSRAADWVYWMRMWMLAQAGRIRCSPARAACDGAAAMPGSTRPIAWNANCVYANGEPVLTRDAGWLYFSASVRPKTSTSAPSGWIDLAQAIDSCKAFVNLSLKFRRISGRPDTDYGQHRQPTGMRPAS